MRCGWRKCWPVVVTGVVLTSQVLGQGVTVIGPDPATVILGGRTRVQLVAEGIDPVLGPLPALPEVKITVGRPEEVKAQGSQPAVRRWTLSLEPRRAGRFEIPPLAVQVGEQTRATPPLVFHAEPDAYAAERAFVELVAPANGLLQNPLEVTLRVGLEQAFRKDGLVQPFRKTLGLPVQLEVPWWEATLPPSGSSSPPAGGAGASLSCVVNGREASAEPAGTLSRGGRTYDVFWVRRVLVPHEEGDVELVAPALKVALATRFRNDLMGGRMPIDRRDALLPGTGARIRIRVEGPGSADASPDDGMVVTPLAHEDLRSWDDGAAGARRPSRWEVVFWCALPWLACVAAGFVTHRRGVRAKDPHPWLAKRALRTCRRRLARGADDLAVPFAEYVGARLRVPWPSVVQRDLAERLRGAGLEAEAASDAAGLLDRMFAARWGGPPVPSEEVRLTLDRLADGWDGRLRS